MMETRILGRTGLHVVPMGFGGMELQHIDQQQAYLLLNGALDLGINYVDTSPEYPRSEEYIGHAIANRRSEYILATKCGDNMTGVGPDYIWDRKTCMTNLEDSLRLMKTDYVDIWQLHAIIPEYIKGGKSDDVIQCMLDAQKAGKVRYLGATLKNGKPEEERHPAEFGYQGIQELVAWDVLDVIQIVYGGLTRRSELRIEEASKKGVGIVARGIVKKYKDWYDEALSKSGIAELFEEGETRSQFLIRFALSNQAINCMVVGTKNLNHVKDNLKAVQKGILSPETFNAAKRRLDAVGITPGSI